MAPFQFLRRDSAVGIATRYGLDGPGIESRRPWGLPNPPVQWVSGTFSGGKLLGGGFDHPPTSGAEGKERV